MFPVGVVMVHCGDAIVSPADVTAVIIMPCGAQPEGSAHDR